MITKIDTLFGSRTRAALLNDLLMHSDESFYLRELSERVGTAFSAVHKEIANLKKLGLVTEERKGRQRFVRINRQSPLFEELKKLFVKTAGLGGVLREALSGVKDVRFALVYGSFARGDFVASSDVDLLVVGETREEDLLETVKKTEHVVGREVNYVLWRETDLRRKAKAHVNLVESIKNNPVLMLVGNENEFRKIVGGPRNSKNIA